MIKQSLFLLFFLIFFSGIAQEFKQKDSETKVEFTIRNFGVNVDGDFSDVNISTNFNAESLAESYLNAEIKVKSIATGIESRDEHLLEEDYFDEPNHKWIRLKSTAFRKTSDADFTMIGDLTIKGITKQIQIPLKVSESEDQISIQSYFEINRRDFNVGGGSLIMSKTVKIEVVYSGTR
jgi:polyisoprenoid-binding protein YceI